MEKEFDMLFPTCIIENNNLLYVTDYEHIFEKIDINIYSFCQKEN